MIHILVCDDDPVFAGLQTAALSEILDRMGENHEIHSFSGGEMVPRELLCRCDIAFLDIDFPRESYNGIDIARTLRECNREASVIFVTNFVEYAPEGYEVQALRYLLKREAPQKLESYLRLALQRLRQRRRTYAVQIGGGTVYLPVEDILYLESRKHACVAFVQEKENVKEYCFYAALRAVEKDLENSGFLRIQKSYLVNMRHIQRFQCREVKLTGEIVLPVSPRSYAEQKQKYLFWKGGQ